MAIDQLMLSPPVFCCFLSHASVDANDCCLDRFFEDFLEELRGRLGAHATDSLGFRSSSSIPLGAAWQPNLERALLGCRAFIAMLSPAYLRQPACRREWACFEWRLQTFGGTALPDLLLPLVWIPILEGDLPPAIRRRQIAPRSLGSSYASRGLRHVVQRGGVEYRDLLTALADHVRDLVRLPALPSPSSLELTIPDELPDPFAIEPSQPPPPAIGASSFAEGPRAPAIIMSNPSRPNPAPRRHIILFLAANPNGTTRLALDDECAAIERELRITTTGRDDFEFRSKWAVSIDDIMRHLNELQPTILHFSGHGGGSPGIVIDQLSDDRRIASSRDIDVELELEIATAGIQLQDEQRRPQHVTARALTRMIETAAPCARVVVLNACFSEAVADALRGVVDCVVGMRGAIGDDAARSFAVGFYRALGHRRSVGNAVAQAIATLTAKRSCDEHLPICVTRDGVKADQIILVPSDHAHDEKH
jgi:hypothetical protein